jgi:trimethylamine--corrinoid protein Co-methyltransferase
MRTFIFGGQPYFGAFGPRSGSKIPDQQAMMEKTIGAMFAVFCGCRTFTSIGTLAYADIFSLVQLLLDLELTSYANRLISGLECNGDERMAEKLNIEMVPQGARFMENEHTFKFFRSEQWYPQFCDRRVANAWLSDPDSMIAKARKRALGIVETAENKCTLDAGQKSEIEKILAEADVELKQM